MNYYLKNVFILFLFLNNLPLQAQQYLLEKADSLFQVKNYKESAKLSEALIRKGEKDLGLLYLAAVSYAQLKNEQKSIEHLTILIQNHYDDIYLSNIRFDLLLNPIKHTNAWQKFIQKETAHFEKAALSISFPSYRRELLELWKSDQYYRSLIFGKYNGRPPNEVANATEAVDRFNAMRLEEIVNEIGWPTFSKVGKDGAHAAWNIIQHAVFNPPFMKIVLDKMKTELEQNEVDPLDYVYLFDRFHAVSLLEQTDYGIVTSVPIRKEYLVEKRRKNLGVESLSNYYQNLNKPPYQVPTKEEWKKRETDLKKNYAEFIEKANIQFTNKDYDLAAKFYGKAMRCYGYIQTKDIYNCARAYAQHSSARYHHYAIFKIQTLAARGFSDVEKLKNDPAFDRLKTNKLWIEIIKVIEKYNGQDSKF